MRYRQLAPNGDSTIFSGDTLFLVNSPAAVAQAVLTRLRLWQGEWFLDTTLGVPFLTQVIGRNTQAVRDTAVQATILGTPGVNQILSYQSQLVGRNLMIQVTIDTIYGSTAITSGF